MIQILIERQCWVCKGHADSGGIKNDLVCAAVSSIILGAADYWESMDSITFVQKEGYLKLNFINSNDKLTIEKEVVLQQIKKLTSEYKDYVQLVFK